MTIDLAANANHLLSQIHKPEPPKLWVECEDCDSMGYCLKWRGFDGSREMVERTCDSCTEGYVQVEEGDSRWDKGTLAHPND
ncbi:MAG: hypothetical protein KAJ55_00085 [Anaerolineales bacterium]|nr:hypothetical protein [Anaerolineales bacterium]